MSESILGVLVYTVSKLVLPVNESRIDGGEPQNKIWYYSRLSPGLQISQFNEHISFDNHQFVTIN